MRTAHKILYGLLAFVAIAYTLGVLAGLNGSMGFFNYVFSLAITVGFWAIVGVIIIAIYDKIKGKKAPEQTKPETIQKQG